MYRENCNKRTLVGCKGSDKAFLLEYFVPVHI